MGMKEFQPRDWVKFIIFWLIIGGVYLVASSVEEATLFLVIFLVSEKISSW